MARLRIPAASGWPSPRRHGEGPSESLTHTPRAATQVNTDEEGMPGGVERGSAGGRLGQRTTFEGLVPVALVAAGLVPYPAVLSAMEMSTDAGRHLIDLEPAHQLTNQVELQPVVPGAGPGSTKGISTLSPGRTPSRRSRESARSRDRAGGRRDRTGARPPGPGHGGHPRAATGFARYCARGTPLIGSPSANWTRSS